MKDGGGVGSLRLRSVTGLFKRLMGWISCWKWWIIA